MRMPDATEYKILFYPDHYCHCRADLLFKFGERQRRAGLVVEAGKARPRSSNAFSTRWFSQTVYEDRRFELICYCVANSLGICFNNLDCVRAQSVAESSPASSHICPTRCLSIPSGESGLSFTAKPGSC